MYEHGKFFRPVLFLQMQSETLSGAPQSANLKGLAHSFTHKYNTSVKKLIGKNVLAYLVMLKVTERKKFFFFQLTPAVNVINQFFHCHFLRGKKVFVPDKAFQPNQTFTSGVHLGGAPGLTV